MACNGGSTGCGICVVVIVIIIGFVVVGGFVGVIVGVVVGGVGVIFGGGDCSG